MTLKGIEKQYDKLTSDERFHLAVDTWSRMDKIELGKLFSSAPRKNYSCIENFFISKWEASETIALSFSYMLMRALLGFTLLQTCAVSEKGLKNLGYSKNLAEEKKVAYFVEAYKLVIGYRRFCKSKHLDPEKLLLCWIGHEPFLQDPLSLYPLLLDENDVDQEELTEREDYFHEVWEKCTGEPTSRKFKP